MMKPQHRHRPVPEVPADVVEDSAGVRGERGRFWSRDAADDVDGRIQLVSERKYLPRQVEARSARVNRQTGKTDGVTVFVSTAVFTRRGQKILESRLVVRMKAHMAATGDGLSDRQCIPDFAAKAIPLPSVP